MIKIEEFMVFENDDNNTGVIIKSDNEFFDWWKCFRKTGGQLFSEDNCSVHRNIIKLFKCNNLGSEKYYALKYMLDGDLSRYDCVYDKNKKESEIKPVNTIINISVNGCNDSKSVVEQIIKKLQDELIKINMVI